MKARILTLAVLISNLSFCQYGSDEYTNAMYDKIGAYKSYMDERFKDTFMIRRIETGVLYNVDDQVFGTTERQLFSGNRYLVIAFTDARLSNLRLKVYKKAGESNWDLVQTVDDNSKTASQSSLIGDTEMMAITPDANVSYKFEISSASASNAAARYSILVFSKDVNPASSAALVYNVDSATISEWDGVKKAYGDWSRSVSYPGFFEMNAEKTIVTWKKNGGTATTYYIIETDESPARWVNYTVRSTDGERYAFMTPKLNGQYVRLSKLSEDAHHPIMDFRIKPRSVPQTKVTYSIDNYSTSSYDTKSEKYLPFGNQTTFSCLFEINAGETSITWREASGSVTVFEIVDKDDSDNRWLTYTIKSSGGNRYEFMVPKNDFSYIRVVKKDGKANNALTDYHVVRRWND